MLLTLLAVLLATPSVAAPRADVVSSARQAVDCAVKRGDLQSGQLLTVIDYRLPSSEPRLWVLDPDGSVLFEELVAHGQGTGADQARDFSDVQGSHQSSLGLFVTAETYTGKHGHSLRLDGL